MKMRRVLCMLMLTALLAAIPQAGFAISAQEALFGSDALLEAADNPVPEAPEDDIYAGTDTQTVGQYPTLSLGDKDDADSTAFIVFLQNRLIELGYLRDSADGYFGENTETAVSAFQKNNGLAQTGIADAETQQKLYSDASTLVAASEDSTMFGGKLTRVQTALGTWGFYGGKVDGVAGKGTDGAVTTFKSYMTAINPTFGTTPTPAPTATPNPEGRFADMPMVVDEPLNVPEDTSLTDATITNAVMEYVDGDREFIVYRQTVQKGDSGREVQRVQTRLRQLNYLYYTDGNFGDVSVAALKYFQRKHDLPETGVADAVTQELLFSSRAIQSEEYVFPYKLVVDISDQRVYVYQWLGASYEGPVREFACSSGKKETPTPLGTYQAAGKAGGENNGEWYYFKEFNCYAKWGYVIVGGILFHSITFDKNKKQTGSESSLGRRASHGCVRLSIANAKWIYDNCPSGTTVVIQE